MGDVIKDFFAKKALHEIIIYSENALADVDILASSTVPILPPLISQGTLPSEYHVEIQRAYR